MGECVFVNRNGFDYGAAPKFHFAALLGFLALALLAAIASGCVAAVNMRGWYAALNPPLFRPPNPLPIWLWAALAGLYVALALAGWLVWRQGAGRQRAALNFWGWLLALGAAWPAAFFGLHLLAPALSVAAGLAACAAVTLWRFARLDRAAALLLIPYFGYAAGALYLNAGFWWLNH